jgi:hypothetical protein
MNPTIIQSSTVSIREEITISATVASGDLSDTIQEKKKFRKTA